MELNRTELSDLADFFARRFPDPAMRARLSAKLRSPVSTVGSASPLQGWSQLLADLHERGRLHRLAPLVARQDVHDENLQQVCAVLAGGRGALLDRVSRPQALVAGAAAVAAVGLVGLVGLALSAGSDVEHVGVSADAVASAGSPSVAQPEPPALVSTVPTPSQRRTTLPASAAALPTPASAPEATPVASVVPQEEQPANVKGRCTTREGGVVGYWYAGRTSPGAQGSTITVSSAVRVRADYPDVHNDFNARAPIRCFLAAGDRVRLTAGPLHVPGDAYWVPLHSGDLIAQ